MQVVTVKSRKSSVTLQINDYNDDDTRNNKRLWLQIPCTINIFGHDGRDTLYGHCFWKLKYKTYIHNIYIEIINKITSIGRYSGTKGLVYGSRVSISHYNWFEYSSIEKINNL